MLAQASVTSVNKWRHLLLRYHHRCQAARAKNSGSHNGDHVADVLQERSAVSHPILVCQMSDPPWIHKRTRVQVYIMTCPLIMSACPWFISAAGLLRSRHTLTRLLVPRLFRQAHKMATAANIQDLDYPLQGEVHRWLRRREKKCLGSFLLVFRTHDSDKCSVKQGLLCSLK